MKIAASRASGSASYSNYAPWLRTADPSVDVVDLWTSDSPEEAVARLRDCAGLVLTGGPDVDPVRYGRPELADRCGPIDARRDALEFALVQAATDMRLPVFGICRGAQLLNVAYGGTLHADLPTDLGTTVDHAQHDGVDATHHVDVEGGSLVKRICRVIEGTVNSAHHQGVDVLASLFAPAAIADDGVIEAFDWGDATLGGKPFLLAVQWHPERMAFDNPLSGPLAHHFLAEAAAYETLVARRPYPSAPA